MRAASRRRRTPDPLASPEAVRRVLGALRAALPGLAPGRDPELVRMLRAARHVSRYAATDTRRGRPGRWGRDELLRVSARLSDLLARETSSRTSPATFVDHHLRLLSFPQDVTAALADAQINLFEAEQLARVTDARLGVTPAEAKRTRADLLASHLQTRGSGERLRRRVNELLGAPAAEARPSPGSGGSGPELEDMEDFDPYDPTHLFWDQIKQLGFAFREIRREDVTDEEVEELLKASEPVMAIVAKIQRRKGQTQTRKMRL